MIENEGPQDHTEENGDTDSQPESGQTGGCQGATANWKTLVPFKGVMGERGPRVTPTTFWQTGTQLANQTFVIVQLLLLASNSKLLSSLVLKAVAMGVQLGWTHPPIYTIIKSKQQTLKQLLEGSREQPERKWSQPSLPCWAW